MSSPIEKRKEQLKKYIEAREKASEGSWSDGHYRIDEIGCDFYRHKGADLDEPSDIIFITLAANESAQIARDLLDALEALEEAQTHFDAIMSGLTTDINRVEFETKKRAYEAGVEVRATLAKLSKGDEA